MLGQTVFSSGVECSAHAQIQMASVKNFDQSVRLATFWDFEIGLQSHGNHAKILHFAGPVWGPENGPQNVPAYLQSNKAAPKTVPFSGPQNGPAKFHIFGFFLRLLGAFTGTGDTHKFALHTPMHRQPQTQDNQPPTYRVEGGARFEAK